MVKAVFASEMEMMRLRGAGWSSGRGREARVVIYKCNVHPYRVKVTDIRQCQDNLLGRSFVCGMIGVILSSSNHNLSLCAYSTGDSCHMVHVGSREKTV